MAMPLLANKLVNRNNQLRRKFALRAPTVILSRVCVWGGGYDTFLPSARHRRAAPFGHFRGPEGGRRGCKTAPQWERSLGNARGVLTEPRPPHGSREPHPGSTPWSLTRDSLTHALGGAFTFATQSDPTCPVPPMGSAHRGAPALRAQPWHHPGPRVHHRSPVSNPARSCHPTIREASSAHRLVHGGRAHRGGRYDIYPPP